MFVGKVVTRLSMAKEGYYIEEACKDRVDNANLILEFEAIRPCMKRYTVRNLLSANRLSNRRKMVKEYPKVAIAPRV